MWAKGGHQPYPGPPPFMYNLPYGKGAPVPAGQVWTRPPVKAEAHPSENHPPVAPKHVEDATEGAKFHYKDKTRTLAEWYSRPDTDGNFFIGDGEEEDHHRATVDLSTAVRGLCTEYFEYHISPLIRSIHNTTEHQQLQLQELQKLVGQDLRETVAVEVARRNEQNTVSTLVRLQEISASLQKKADITSVPTMSQWKALNARIEKADVGDQANESLKQLNELEERLSSAMSKADGNHQSLQEKVEAMEKDLQKLARPEEIPKRLQATDDTFGAELHKVKALVAAAGANFNKQIKDLRQQVKGLREETTQASGPVGLGSLEERWPGRGVSNGPPSDAGSEQCSDVGSVTASLAGSVVAGMAPEEKAELRKMQVVVSAAATTFSKDIKEVRKCLGEVQADLSNLKAMAGL